MKGLTEIPGIQAGHVSDYEALTGCTVVLCTEGAVAGVAIGGSATGTQELDLMSPLHVTPHIHAVCLAGGSAFGLETAAGVRRALERQGVGYPTGHAKVPLVPGAILYDLGIGRSDVRPGREMGEAAVKAATSDAVAEGCVGAGTGATVGKVLGMKQAMKGGIGSWSASIGSGGARIAALAVVNAWGDVIDPRTRNVIAGARTAPGSREFADSAAIVRRGRGKSNLGENTSLVVVATNVKLTKPQATRLAQLSQHGLVQAISPVHTIYDGDIVFALSTGSESVDFNALCLAAAEVTAEAIVRAARSAWTLGGVPGLAAAPQSKQ
jgi:L-aminopeptidase/D-esterase-like protein